MSTIMSGFLAFACTLSNKFTLCFFAFSLLQCSFFPLIWVLDSLVSIKLLIKPQLFKRTYPWAMTRILSVTKPGHASLLFSTSPQSWRLSSFDPSSLVLHVSSKSVLLQLVLRLDHHRHVTKLVMSPGASLFTSLFIKNPNHSYLLLENFHQMIFYSVQ